MCSHINIHHLILHRHHYCTLLICSLERKLRLRFDSSVNSSLHRCCSNAELVLVANAASFLRSVLLESLVLQSAMATVIQVALLLVGLLSLPAAQAGWYASQGYNEGWVFGHGTWYGDPYGEGSSGGNCGYTELAGTPYGPKIVAGSPAIYANGLGCGQCYRVRCTDGGNGPRLCNSYGTQVVVTDFCPGGTYCSSGQKAFDFSGAALNAMALPGKAAELRNRGLYNVLYKRVPCQYRGQNVAFRVVPGSSAYWLSVLIKYVGGPGDIGAVYIRMANSFRFVAMQHAWGANWMLQSYDGKPFQGPMDIKIVSRLNGHSVVARGVIPRYFWPGATYNSRVQMAF